MEPDPTQTIILLLSWTLTATITSSSFHKSIRGSPNFGVRGVLQKLLVALNFFDLEFPDEADADLKLTTVIVGFRDFSYTRTALALFLEQMTVVVTRHLPQSPPWNK